MEENKNVKNKRYWLYATIFVAILILGTVTVTFAYFNVRVDKTGYSQRTASASIDCINIEYSEANTISLKLQYNYPISDTYALQKLTPVTVTVKNSCTNNIQNVNYTLALTSLKNSSGFINDNQIRMHVKRTLAGGTETVLKPTDYLNSLGSITNSNALTYLNNDLNKRDITKNYATKTNYLIDSSSIAQGKSNVYKVYLWVDYYEGDTTHTGQKDNDTQNKNFAAAVSLVVNP